MRVWRDRDRPDPNVAGRAFDKLLRQRLTLEQRRQVDVSRERMRRQVAAGEPVTDAQGRPLARSEPYVLAPLNELHFDDTDAPERAG